MKKIEFTTWERQTCIEVLSLQRGDTRLLHKILKLFDVLVLSEEEKKLVGWTEESATVVCPDCGVIITLNQVGRARWKNTEWVFALEFENLEFKFLAATITKYEQWVGGSARLVVQLTNKLENVSAAS